MLGQCPWGHTQLAEPFRKVDGVGSSEHRDNTVLPRQILTFHGFNPADYAPPCVRGEHEQTLDLCSSPFASDPLVGWKCQAEKVQARSKRILSNLHVGDSMRLDVLVFVARSSRCISSSFFQAFNCPWWLMSHIRAMHRNLSLKLEGEGSFIPESLISCDSKHPE